MAELIYLVCDESGAKGYDDKPEGVEAELGVMAGFLVPGAALADVRMRLGAIANEFTQAEKLHITTLPADRQAELRGRIFTYLSAMASPSPCLLYEAIHQQGFHKWGEMVRSAAAKANAARRSSVAISAHESRELLHSELFTGLFSKAVVFAIDQFGWGHPVKIVVLTDRIDEPIRRDFAEAASRLLRGGEPEAQVVKGYDRETKQLVRGELRTAIRGSEKLGELSSITCEIASENTPLTVAADVLANSIHHHLAKLRTDDQRGASLNTQAVITGHPLDRHFYACWDETMEGNYAADALFMHPRERHRINPSWPRRMACAAWRRVRRLWS